MKQISLIEFENIKTSQTSQSLSQNSQNNTKTKRSKVRLKSMTMWTDEEWQEHYWKLTKEKPLDLVKRAISSNNDKLSILINQIVNGFHEDKRKRKDKTEDLSDWIPDGKWYKLYRLQQAMKEMNK